MSKLSLLSKWCKLEVDRFDRRDPATVRRTPIFRMPREQLLLPAAMIDLKGITWVERRRPLPRAVLGTGLRNHRKESRAC